MDVETHGSNRFPNSWLRTVLPSTEPMIGLSARVSTSGLTKFSEVR
jgi:hypothetical protein